MRMEADRMANLRITEKELIPERQVVLEERRMRIDNSPAALLGEAVQEQLYGRHKPYGMPISGYVDDVKKLNVHDLAAFYAKWYMPNNAVLIVAGDTTADQVRKLAEKHYGPIAARKVDPRRRPGEGASDLPQRVTRADARVAEPRWSRYYLAPSYHKGESQYAYALQVLARLLGGGETSRLWKALVVDRKIALSAWASYSPSSLGLTSFDLGVHPASGTPMVEVESAVGGLLGKLLDDGVTPRKSSGRRTSSWPPRSIRRIRCKAARASTAARSASAARWPTSMPGRSASAPSRRPPWSPPRAMSGAPTGS